MATERHPRRLWALALLAAMAGGCFEFVEDEAAPAIRCSASNTWCPDGFYCHVTHWQCRRFECRDGCAATERCVDGVCVEWLGCELAAGVGCAGCACEDCVCAFYPECCAPSAGAAPASQYWDTHCVDRCRLCGGCGATAVSPCAGGACPDIDWVTIPGGTYEMGDERHFLDEAPRHEVTVPGFAMARTEVTVAQYRACVDAGACTAPDQGGACPWGRADHDDHPVHCISWHQARTFAEWMGGRLPSEAEWEFAARSGAFSIRDREWPWGNEPPTCAHAVFRHPTDDYADEGCGTRDTFPVCANPAQPGATSLGLTAQGLCDMAGNVFEWVEDDYFGSYDCAATPDRFECTQRGTAPTDGSAWVGVPIRGSRRVVRGGNFFAGASYLRPAARSDDTPSSRSAGTGLRPVRDLSP